MVSFRSCLKFAVLMCLLCHFATDGLAQAYPTKRIRYLVTGSSGSGTDTLGRLVAEGLSQVLKQQVVVDNRPGGGSNIAADIAAKAPADGYTVLQMTITLAVNVSLYHKLPYDLIRDLAPVTQLATGPAVVVVHPSLPVRSVSELVRLAKARPGAINYASAGSGTFTFLAAELFKGQAGVNMLHVPYRGGGPALTAVVSGETSVYFAPIAVALPNIREGRLRPLAVTSAKRVPLMPDIPTLAESGLPGYECGNWYGLMVPANTPKQIITAIRGAVVTVLNNPGMNKHLDDLGFIPVGDRPEEFELFIKSEVARLGKIVRDLHLRAD